MSWYQLLAIYEDAVAEAEFYASQPPANCPNDGEPLRQVAPESGSADQLYCPFDGWRYPRDWNVATMAGM